MHYKCLSLTWYEYFGLGILIILPLIIAYQQPLAPNPQFINPATKFTNEKSPELLFEIKTISDTRQSPSVHAATASYIHNQSSPYIEVLWFGGQREGASDVAIYSSKLDLTNQQWSAPKIAVSRQMLSQQSKTYIKKLGNPVLYQSKDGTKHLFVVAVSLGGWAGARIYHLKADNTAANTPYQFVQILPLSPFLNISHLVRGIPIGLADGGFYLPIYHEMARKYEVLLRFDANGRLISRQRPNRLVGTLQPWITPISSNECLSVRRNTRDNQPLLLQACRSGGENWLPPIATNITNDNNSVNILQLPNNTLIIHNQAKEQNSRFFLQLSQYDKQHNYTQYIATLDTALSQTEGEVSYPTTLVVNDKIYVFYTKDRKTIRSVVFNSAWLTQALSKQDDLANHVSSQIDYGIKSNEAGIL